ncbi:MAG TPA: class I SAM-dependent methyltransferase [Thermoanaerobaculia bacterium]|jgi:2-polyprenyl-3-methyl-5-hydroxy-6-metoxy-1,4-benzoquinol methylase|nr:class I SAM-dependent methyltransferase [Thermoanaerobaculia bacterium]
MPETPEAAPDPPGSHDPAYFEREYFQLHPGKQKYLDYLVGLLRRFGVTGGRVLDVGSGYGFFLAALEQAGYQPVGLELSAHAVAIARGRTAAEIATGSAEAPFPFPDQSFDAITLLDVIEHLDHYPATLAHCRRTLKPGGILFVITLNSGSLARPLLGKKWSFHLDPTHVHMFSAARLRGALVDSGLTPIALTTMSNFCSVGEGNPVLKPLRVIGRVVTTPWLGDSLLGIGRRA